MQNGPEAQNNECDNEQEWVVVATYQAYATTPGGERGPIFYQYARRGANQEPNNENVVSQNPEALVPEKTKLKNK